MSSYTDMSSSVSLPFSSLMEIPSLPTFLDNPEVLGLGDSADVLALGDPGFSNFKLFFALGMVLGFSFVLCFGNSFRFFFCFLSS